MFGPVPAKHLRFNDPYAASLGLRCAALGTVLTCEYKGDFFEIPLGGDNRFHGYKAHTPHARGLLLRDAEISVTGIVPTLDAGPSEEGLVAVLDGVIAVSALLHPFGDSGPTYAMLVDVVSGKPVPLNGPSDALWFREWTISARFPEEDGFPIASTAAAK